jgi:predicted DNA-binding transcriptional regulator AlpA
MGTRLGQVKRGFALREAASYCGIPKKTIYEAKRRGASLEAKARFPVPGVKRGKAWLFDRKDLDAWLDKIFAEKQ